MADILSRPQCTKRAPDVLLIPQRNTHTHTHTMSFQIKVGDNKLLLCGSKYAWLAHQLNNGRSGFPEVLVNQYVVYIGWI